MLTRMAVARAAKLEPLKVSAVPVNHTALIIGGGAAGMTAALILADQGFPVHLVERDGRLGGNLWNLRYFEPVNDQDKSLTPSEYLAEMIHKVKGHALITTHLNTEFESVGGFKGNFTSTLRNGKSFQIQHGVTIVATGGQEYRGNEYGYGQSEQIVTQLEFEQILADNKLLVDRITAENPQTPQHPIPQLPDSVVMIQCVGPAEKFCARLCCTTALKNALKLKEIKPQAEVTILYRDIRTYGFKERLYTEARRKGIRFVQYEFEHKPKVRIGVSANWQGQESSIAIKFHDSILNRDIELNPDLLVLSSPIIPAEGTRQLASKLKISTDMDGFFLEAHVKLRPVDFSAEGVFMAGMAHYPKFLDETIAQAQAAASRAASILAQETMLTNARVARVDAEKCVGCLTCVRICPYEVPQIRNDYAGVGSILGAAFVEPAICHGCGTCAAECPAQAIQLMHYTDAQTLRKLDALFGISDGLENVIPIENF